MSAGTEQALKGAEALAQTTRMLAEKAEREAMNATIDFMDLAVTARWSWERIGRALGISGTAARRYYDRNRRRTHNGSVRG